MDFDAIRDRIEALVKLGGFATTVPGPNYAFLANEGLRLFTRESQHNVEELTITTVSGQELYSTLFTGSTPVADTRDWISLYDDAVYNGVSWLPMTTRDKLRAGNPLYRDASNSTPSWWFWTRPFNQIGLFPKPDAVVNINFMGARHEPVLDAGTDVPLLGADFHEGICLFGAWHWGKLHSRGEEREIAKEYREEALGYTARCKELMANQEAQHFTRQVRRSRPEYMGLGSTWIRT